MSDVPASRGVESGLEGWQDQEQDSAEAPIWAIRDQEQRSKDVIIGEFRWISPRWKQSRKISENPQDLKETGHNEDLQASKEREKLIVCMMKLGGYRAFVSTTL